MNVPLMRPLTPDDMVALCGLINLANAHDGLRISKDVDEVREDIGPPTLELGDDTLGAFIGGDLVGAVWVHYLPAEVVNERCYVFGAVHPGHRRLGIGRQLMAWGVSRADALLATGTNELPKYVCSSATEGADDARRLFARFGLEPVRYFDDLVMPLTDIAPAPVIPGIDIVAWPVERSAEIHAVKNTAFASHWGSTPTNDETWEQIAGGFGSRPDLSFVALDADGHIVALLLSYRYEADDEVLGSSQGYIDKIATLPEWREHGIARALILTALHRFREEGLTQAALDVDSDSPTGANRLYTSIGFTPRSRSITFRTSAR